mmetsp:Transcript_28455/g.69028  ORF Transcript_28455/g.69028 Transcript_28455/m.69028 type:complete len:211 (-) Transcript_28455:57-689(-)
MSRVSSSILLIFASYACSLYSQPITADAFQFCISSISSSSSYRPTLAATSLHLNPLPLSTGTGTSTGTSLDAFKWFGASPDDEDDKQENSDEFLTSTNLGNVASVIDSMSNFKKSQRIEERTNTVIKDLSATMLTGESSDGKVKITFNGQMKPMGVEIDPEYFQTLKADEEGSTQLSTAIQQALADVSEKSTRKVEEKMKGIYQDIGFDG